MKLSARFSLENLGANGQTSVIPRPQAVWDLPQKKSMSVDCLYPALYSNSMVKGGYIYILTNENKTVLYCGVTSDLAKRMWEHKNKVFPGFTKKYNVETLVYYEFHDTIKEAIFREKMIKKKSRRGKIKLIEQKNPEWNNLLF